MAELILANIERKLGHLNHEDIYDVTFVDIVDLQVYMTVVDTSYRNYTRSGWDRIVAQDQPYGLYSGLIKTKRRDRDGQPVVSADSHPQLIEPFTADEVFNYVESRKEQLGLD